MNKEPTAQTVAFAGDPYQIPSESGTQTEALHLPPVFALRAAPLPWLREAIWRLQNLATLQENWDSYGARAIDARAVAEAIVIASNLAMVESVEAPAVGGTPEGHVGFSWDGGLWSLDAEVLPNGRIDYVYLDERDSTRDREASTFNTYDLLVFLTQWS